MWYYYCSTNDAAPMCRDDENYSAACAAKEDIMAKRIIGEDVPFLNLEEDNGVLAKVKKFFSKMIGKEK